MTLGRWLEDTRFLRALTLPPNAHYQSALGDIAREHFSREGVYYLDLWPVSGLFHVVVSSHVANQIHANSIMSIERPSLLRRFFRPICGGPSMFDLPKAKWKPWRAILSKGLAQTTRSHLSTEWLTK
jgi:hypothetical protein